MNPKTFTQTVEPEAALPAGAGAGSHCRRVAAWCEEMGRQKLGPRERASLVQAAWRHHRSGLLTESSLKKLGEELGISTNVYEDVDESSALVEEILAVFEHRSNRPGPARELGRLLEAANLLDEQLEFAPFEPGRLEEILTSLPGHVGKAVRSLRMASAADLRAVKPNLPVYPAVAARLCRLLASDNVNLSSLEGVARADQVIAGKLVKAANSAYYSPWQPIRSVAQAISFIGTDDARRILLASSIQPLYSSPRMRRLWKHALEGAQVAERIAELTGKVDPAEAFLLGLLHDVGKLAISMLSRDVNDALERLIDKGCQSAAAEVVLCGFDHAAAGAEILRYWKFTDELVAAVEHHHQPERSTSRMAAVLYLTEYWTDSEEDLPSNARLTEALKMTSLSPEALDASLVNLKGAVTSL